jgi:general secretion pathway protein E
LHTNSAVGSVTRLVDMGVERYLLAPMLVGLVAQRLVRRLCEVCRRAEPADARDVPAARWGDRGSAKADVPGRGMPGLPGRGISGADGACTRSSRWMRRWRQLIHDGAPEAALVAHARAQGPGLMDEGIAAIRAGETTVEEVARVTREEAG